MNLYLCGLIQLTAMNQGQYIFSQLVGHFDRNHFYYLARKYDENKYMKHFSCWNQLLTMMFGQLSNRENLRDVVVALEAQHFRCEFLGIGSTDSKNHVGVCQPEW